MSKNKEEDGALIEYSRLPIEVINKMTKEELYNITKRFQVATTTRRNRLFKEIEENDLPMVSFIDKYRDVKFAPNKKMSLNELRHIAMLQRNFVRDKTSTAKGIIKVLDDFYNRLIKAGIEKGIPLVKEKLSKEQYRKLWEVYNKVENDYRNTGYDSNQIQMLIYRVIQKERVYMSVDDIIEILPNSTTLYEEYQSSDMEDSDVYDFGEHGI